MRRARLEALFARFPSLRVTVMGDLFLDRWYEIDRALATPSIETGLTVHHVVRKRSAAGAAGTVLNNLSEMGVGELRVLSMVGDDGDGWEMLRRLQERHVQTDAVIRSADIVTPSYIKPLFPEEGNRFDIENLSPTAAALEDALMARAEAELDRADALILMDQVALPGTGVLTDRVRSFVCGLAAAHPDKLVVADSRTSIDRYQSVVIKCNNFEAANLTGRAESEGDFDPDAVFSSLEALSRRTGRDVIVTCNKYGITVEEDGRRHLLRAARHPGPIDICGAGDACTAGLVSALAAGGSIAEAAFVGNLSSGVTVRQIGRTGTASRQAMLSLFDEQFGG